MSHRLFAFTVGVLAGYSINAPSVAFAESSALEGPPPVKTDEKQDRPVVPEKKAEKSDTVANRAPAVLSTSCPKASIPVYIENWGRLADLTESDPEIAPISKFWANREDGTSTLLATGTILGTGAILFGTMGRLTNDGWTDTNKWAIAGGAGVILVSALTSWLFSPDRDDLLTVINHWNLRHADRPLAP